MLIFLYVIGAVFCLLLTMIIMYRRDKQKAHFRHFVLEETELKVFSSEFKKDWFNKENCPCFTPNSEDFKYEVLVRVKNIIPTYSKSLKNAVLTKDIDSYTAIDELGINNIFSLEQALSVIKFLTEKQPKGQIGFLSILNQNLLFTGPLPKRAENDPIFLATSWNESSSRWEVTIEKSCVYYEREDVVRTTIFRRGTQILVKN